MRLPGPLAPSFGLALSFPLPTPLPDAIRRSLHWGGTGRPNVIRAISQCDSLHHAWPIPLTMHRYNMPRAIDGHHRNSRRITLPTGWRSIGIELASATPAKGPSGDRRHTAEVRVFCGEKA